MGAGDIEAFLKQQRLDDLERKLKDGEIEMPDPDIPRPPSPEPVYDAEGNHINSRQNRARQAMLAERQYLLEDQYRRDPSTTPPPHYKPPRKQRKIPLPNPPHTNTAVATLAGPRGIMHQELQSRTSTRITVGGRGFSRTGEPGDGEAPFVLVQGEAMDAVESAAGMIEAMVQALTQGQQQQHHTENGVGAAAVKGEKDDEAMDIDGEKVDTAPAAAPVAAVAAPKEEAVKKEEPQVVSEEAKVKTEDKKEPTQAAAATAPPTSPAAGGAKPPAATKTEAPVASESASQWPTAEMMSSMMMPGMMPGMMPFMFPYGMPAMAAAYGDMSAYYAAMTGGAAGSSGAAAQGSTSPSS